MAARVVSVVIGLISLRGADLLCALGPRELDGHQLDYRTHTTTARVLARGCGSTGWIASFYGLHTWILSLWPKATVAEVFANGVPQMRRHTAIPYMADRCSRCSRWEPPHRYPVSQRACSTHIARGSAYG